MNAPRRGVDGRGFRWTLGGLERLREHEVERAAGRLAQAAREKQAVQDAMRSAEASRREQVAALHARGACGLDVALHGGAVAYLRAAALAQSANERELQKRRERLAAEQKTAGDLQRKLEVIRKLRACAWDAYAAAQAQRVAREADLAWLARRGGVR